MERPRPFSRFWKFVNSPDSKDALKSAVNPKPTFTEVWDKKTDIKNNPIGRKKESIIDKLDRFIIDGRSAWVDSLTGKPDQKSTTQNPLDDPRK